MHRSAGWRLEQVDGARLEMVNQTGQVAYDVRLSSHGAVAIARRRNWVWNLPEVGANQALPFSFAFPGAAHQDPPYIRVKYRLSPEEDAPTYEENFDLL